MDGQTQQTQETVVTRSTFVDNARGIWRDFGPLLVGLLVLIVVLAGGWYLWKNRVQPAGEELAVEEAEEEISFNNVPEAELSLGPTPPPTAVAGATPSPSPSPTASPTGSPRALAQNGTKGGQPTNGAKGGQLPQTGIPFAIPAIFTLSALGGLYLRSRT